MFHPSKDQQKVFFFSLAVENKIQVRASRHAIRQAFGSMPCFIYISIEPFFHIKMNTGKSEEGNGEEKMDEVVKRIQKENFRSQISNISLKFRSVSVSFICVLIKENTCHSNLDISWTHPSESKSSHTSQSSTPQPSGNRRYSAPHSHPGTQLRSLRYIICP